MTVLAWFNYGVSDKITNIGGFPGRSRDMLAVSLNTVDRPLVEAFQISQPPGVTLASDFNPIL
jgi:hypothetical protein